jgi:hypothetical protein
MTIPLDGADIPPIVADMDWHDFLNETERARLVELDLQRTSHRAESRRIYDRCRKRMKKAKP